MTRCEAVGAVTIEGLRFGESKTAEFEIEQWLKNAVNNLFRYLVSCSFKVRSLDGACAMRMTSYAIGNEQDD